MCFSVMGRDLRDEMMEWFMGMWQFSGGFMEIFGDVYRE